MRRTDLPLALALIVAMLALFVISHPEHTRVARHLPLSPADSILVDCLAPDRFSKCPRN